MHLSQTYQLIVVKLGLPENVISQHVTGMDCALHNRRRLTFSLPYGRRNLVT